MLVLSRKPGEQILIGDQVKITVVRIGPNTVRIGIDAPGDLRVIRGELQPLIVEIEMDSNEASYLGLNYAAEA